MQLKAEINNNLEESNNIKQALGTFKEDFKEFTNALPNRMEVERAKYLLTSTHNMTARQSAQFGIHHLKTRAEKIDSATAEINRIKTKYAYLAKLEQKVLLSQ